MTIQDSKHVRSSKTVRVNAHLFAAYATAELAEEFQTMTMTTTTTAAGMMNHPSAAVAILPLVFLHLNSIHLEVEGQLPMVFTLLHQLYRLLL